MSRFVKALLLLVIILALVLAGILAMDYFRDLHSLRDLQVQLAESRTTWEAIAEQKETLQEKLKSTEEALKEARLTLRESTERVDALRSDIKMLEAEIAALEP